MKKLYIVVIFIFLLCGCSNINKVAIIYENNNLSYEYEKFESYPKIITIKKYAFEGNYLKTKTIENAYAGILNDILSKQVITEDIIPKISDRLFIDIFLENDSLVNPDFEKGIFWIYVEDVIYRFNPNLSLACIVEEELGEGKIVILTDEAKYYINLMLNHYPYNKYIGTLKDNKLSILKVFDGNSNVNFVIKSFKLLKKESNLYSIELELSSVIEQRYNIKSSSYFSSDNIIHEDQTVRLLRPTKKTSLIINIEGSTEKTFWIDIIVDNTVCTLKIEI